jgi:hypothetical protein
VVHILPDNGLYAWCEHGTPLGHSCQLCQFSPRTTSALPAATGWKCPGCGHSYAPWVPECHHCPQPPALTAKGDAG